MTRKCTIEDVVVRPDNYYVMDEDGEPTTILSQDGEEYLYYCNNCRDVSYSFEETKHHIERSNNEARA